MTKDQIIKHFKINEKQKNLIEIFLEKISEENQKTNLVGKSTLEEPWSRHVCDSVQICKLITNNQSSILDMGTGAGIPGVFLSILGYTNVVMVDSTKKKTDFVYGGCKEKNKNSPNIFAKYQILPYIFFSIFIGYPEI